MARKRLAATVTAAVLGMIVSAGAGCGGDAAPRRPPASRPAAKTDAAKPEVSLTPVTPAQPAADEPIAEGWGDLTGRFVYKGDAPEPMKLNVDKDVEVCTKHHPVDETLLVDSTGGLANVVLYVRDKDVKVHEDYDEHKGESVVIDNEHCRFDPRVALFWTEQTLVLKNSDSVGHNTKADFFANTSFNVLIPANQELTPNEQPRREERSPMPVGCNVHPWMKGWLVVRENPYAAVSAADGTFTIKNLPSGQYEFQLWHEKPGFLSGLQVAGSTTERGRVKITIRPGENDLGEIEVPQFK